MSQPIRRPIRKTNRGFSIYAEGTDQYKKSYSVQESSLATEDCVWVGNDEGGRSHLNVDQARDLHEGLGAWLAEYDENLPGIDEGDPGNLPELFERACAAFDSLTQAYRHLKMDTDADQDMHERLIETTDTVVNRLREGARAGQHHYPRLKTDYVAEMAYVNLVPRKAGDVTTTYETNHGINVDYNAAGDAIGYEIYLR